MDITYYKIIDIVYLGSKVEVSGFYINSLRGNKRDFPFIETNLLLLTYVTYGYRYVCH